MRGGIYRGWRKEHRDIKYMSVRHYAKALMKYPSYEPIHFFQFFCCCFAKSGYLWHLYCGYSLWITLFHFILAVKSNLKDSRATYFPFLSVLYNHRSRTGEESLLEWSLEPDSLRYYCLLFVSIITVWFTYRCAGLWLKSTDWNIVYTPLAAFSASLGLKAMLS